jgi:hypothetical protein
LIELGRFAAERRRKKGQGRLETFDFLGFTHCCGTDPKGRFQIVRLTPRSSDELAAINWLPRGSLPGLAACSVTQKPTEPAQLAPFQSPHPEVRAAIPGSASVSGGAILRVTILGRSRMR